MALQRYDAGDEEWLMCGCADFRCADGIYNFRFLGFCRLSKTDDISM